MELPIWLKEAVIYFVKYGLPIFAFIISGLSYRDSRKSKKIQNRLNSLEEKIKKYELQEKEKEIEDSKKACIEARIYRISKGKYSLKIWNSGRAIAYNVNYSVDENYDSGILRQYVPYEFLDAGKSFEERVVFHSGISPKFPITTTWEDKDGNSKSKEQIISF